MKSKELCLNSFLGWIRVKTPIYWVYNIAGPVLSTQYALSPEILTVMTWKREHNHLQLREGETTFEEVRMSAQLDSPKPNAPH